MRFVIKTIYHQMPGKAMRALNFYTSRPVLLGQPLSPSVVRVLNDQELWEHRAEIEPLISARVIEVRGEDGQAFTYPRNTSMDNVLLPEHALEDEAAARISNEIKEAALPETNPLPLVIPPSLPLLEEPPAMDPNELFFSKVKKAAVKRSGRRARASGER